MMKGGSGFQPGDGGISLSRIDLLMNGHIELLDLGFNGL